MLGVAIVLASAWFGLGAARRLAIPLERIEAFALGGAFALAVAPWLLFLGAWSLGFAAGLPAAVVTLAVLGQVLGRRRRVTLAGGAGPSRLSWIALAILFALLFHGHMLHEEAGGLYTGGSSWGDLALHTSLAQRFTVDELDFSSPIYAGAPLTYPFLGDFPVACLVRGGWSISLAFAVTGWVSVMCGLVLVDALARRIFGRRAAGTIAVWLIVLSGALIGMWHAASDVYARGLPASFADMPSYANQWGRGVTWSNIVCDFFLPQRALLSAFPLVWAAAWLMREVADGAHERTTGRRLLGFAAILVGLTPLFHVHSFLLGLGLVLWLALLRTAGRRDALAWWSTAALALLLAAPQLAWQLGGSFHESFGRWNVGWRAPDGEFWTYWLSNWGVPLALAPVAVIAAIRRQRTGFAMVLATAAVAVFAAGNLYQFQPHDWDNMKFFVYGHMALAVVLGGFLAAWLSAGPVRRVLAVLAIVSMTGTGTLTLVRELDRHDQIASPVDLRLADALRSRLPPDARVLTSDQHNHVIPMLTGRRVVMGYRGWLWTHGINYRPMERDVAAMFDGGGGATRLFRRHGVTHVYIGPGEVRDWRADAAWFRARYPRILEQDGVEVFDVRVREPASRARVNVVAARGMP